MPRKERIDRLIREKLDYLNEKPPDFVWDNISKNTIQTHSANTINEIDKAIKNKLNNLEKEPPRYVWTHVQYHLELLSIWQNIKRILIWQRLKRTLKTLLIATTIYLISDYPLNNYILELSFSQPTNYQTDQANRNLTTFKTFNPTQQLFNPKLAQRNISQKTYSKTEKGHTVETSRITSSQSYSKNKKLNKVGNNMQPTTSLTNAPAYSEQNDIDDTKQMFHLPPLGLQPSKPKAPSSLEFSGSLPTNHTENTSIPLWQVDMGTQFSLMVSSYLLQSIFSSEFVSVNPGFLTSFYFGRIITGGKHIYRIGMVYGGFDSKFSVLIDGKWQKETIESRYMGLTASIGKLLFTPRYKRWIDGWLNTSIVYFMYHIYSSEISRINPTSNKVGILLSGELNYLIGLNNGDILLIGGRLHALPISIFQQKGIGKFINLELHLGMRL